MLDCDREHSTNPMRLEEVKRRTCPLCGRDNKQVSPLQYSRQPWLLKNCRGCEFVYLENPVEYSQLVTEFAWERTSAFERQRRNNLEPSLAQLSRLSKNVRKLLFKRDKLKTILQKEDLTGNLLDIGCGRGGVLASSSEKIVPYGIEISKELATRANNIAAARGGFVIHSDALSGLALLQENYFSIVILSAFLEHENQPTSLLSGVFRVLKPDGKVVIKVPNFGSINRVIRGQRWCGFRFPDHVNYFTARTLRRMVEREELQVAKFSVWDRHPFSDNIWMIAEKPHTTARPQKSG